MYRFILDCGTVINENAKVLLSREVYFVVFQERASTYLYDLKLSKLAAVSNILEATLSCIVDCDLGGNEQTQASAARFEKLVC